MTSERVRLTAGSELMQPAHFVGAHFVGAHFVGASAGQHAFLESRPPWRPARCTLLTRHTGVVALAEVGDGGQTVGAEWVVGGRAACWRAGGGRHQGRGCGDAQGCHVVRDVVRRQHGRRACRETRANRRQGGGGGEGRGGGQALTCCGGRAAPGWLPRARALAWRQCCASCSRQAGGQPTRARRCPGKRCASGRWVRHPAAARPVV